MSRIFKQPSAVSCFYCQSILSPTPRNPRSFRCPHCECMNHYNANGEIVSDDPAMHDETYNKRSFARRGMPIPCPPTSTYGPKPPSLAAASPRKDRLPSTHGSTSFCHTCQTNQMLLQNLLANSLPPPEVRLPHFSANPLGLFTSLSHSFIIH